MLGVQDRVTPALVSEAARQVASGTQEQARTNLARQDIELGKKTLARLIKNFGSKALQYREQRVSTGEATELGSVAGRRIVIGTDGGRLRSRVPKKRGRKKANGRWGFYGPWREPKVLVVYEIDDQGRQRKIDGLRYYDATMGDADDAFALLAGVLRSVDAGKAAEWNIVGDGAWWIWNRVRRLVNLRMKGNGIFWRLDNAERLLFLRGQLLAGRWDSFIDAVLQPAELQAAH